VLNDFVERGLTVRDTVSESHLSTLDVAPTTTGVEEIIFSNSSCILAPEGEIGPFCTSPHVPSHASTKLTCPDVLGEYIRTDIRETQPGVDVIIDAQFLDVNTCGPISDLMWDLWHCNSTGVYGGDIGNGNGDSNYLSNLNNTALRGLTATDDDGVAQFTSLFPGHYSGRATHMHVVGHLNGTILDNGTYTGGNIAHIGQLFFDHL
jgi:protocatechuate 3,4-dioxygenase beta subunit